ncbi:pollen receptor-like kinase 2 [Lactuca sativa]|uniref:Protein kinase domain-containing protein n=1 Tax=Lactuca sativa TaxID=4236 RepID=A0A9R1UT82_LACSA|nr:pollen receptor-like kinase 2 [Lactuca sativa]KAJ0193108.1 hypothetical protein LSAT_V11C800417300 [Lactuca sativa]
MGAHLYVRAPVPSSCSMFAHSTLGHFVFLLFLISTIQHVNGSDLETLFKFKNSLINGRNLTTWTSTEDPCNNNTANWEGIFCTNGTVSAIKLERMGLEGNIDATILARLKSLVSISFMDNNLKGSFPDFGMLYGIREILLSNNKFSGEIPANAFKGLKWLEKLYLANNKLMGQIPVSVTSLPMLKELLLENNHLEGEIPKFYKTNLTLANFANNHFNGRIPEGFQNFSASLFLGNEQLCGQPLEECQRNGASTATIIIIALVLATAVGAVLFAVVILSSRRHQDPDFARIQNHGSTVLGASANLSMKEKGASSARKEKKADLSMKLTFLIDDEEVFDLADLLKASAEVLGSGMFGSSYKTALASGKVMVVKRFRHMNNVGQEEFYEHMKRLGRLRHPNILPLVAFYYRKEEKLFVSEYIDNISLSYHIHGNQSNEIRSLDWPTRLRIMKGVVKGLHSLYIKLPSLIVPHGHLKSSNVLLNKNYEPLLADYGLVPVTNPEHAFDLMMAYKSPEYKQHGRISKRTDIWCLGIMILEVLTGKILANTLHLGKGNESDLTDFINSVANQELNIDVFDKEMAGFNKSSEEEMIKLLKIGLSCCEKDANKRMDIKQVVEKIEELKEKEGMEDDFQSTYSSEPDKQSLREITDDNTN